MSIGDFLAGAGQLATWLNPATALGNMIGSAQGRDQFLSNPLSGSINALNGPPVVQHAFGSAVSATENLPVVHQAFQVIDSPRRAIDTALITAQHSEAVGQKTNTSQWGEMFNGTAWARAWDAASWDTPNRVTGGQIVTGTAFRGGPEYDPLDTAEAQKLQDAATGTWYGRTMTTAVDLGESMIALPGTRILARGRQAAGIRSAAEADAVAARFAETGGAVGRTAAQKAADVGKRYVVPNAAQNIDNLVQRQVEGLRPLDGINDQWQVFNKLKSRLPTAPDDVIANMANVFTQINRIPDAVTRERVRTNYWLTMLGSSSAKRAFIEDAPLIVKNFENLSSGTIRQADVMTELYRARIDPNTDLPIETVVDQVFGKTSDKAEMAALKTEVLARKDAYKTKARLVGELRALKPKVLDTPDARHIKMRRGEMQAEVKRLQDELRVARQDLHGTRRWVAGASKRIKQDGVDQGLPNVQDFNQALGDARRRVTDLEAQLKQARSDRTLLEQTPLHDPQAMAAWQERIDKARWDRAVAGNDVSMTKDAIAAKKDAIKAKNEEIAAVQPYVDKANEQITHILDSAGTDVNIAVAGDAKTTALEQLKQQVRDRIGGDHYVVTGDGNTIVRLRTLPTRAARMALAPQARGAIAIREVGLGAQQLADTMARSRVFKPEEIAAARSELIRVSEARRVNVVSRYQDQMLERMAYDFYSKKIPGITPEEAVTRAKEVTGLATRHWGKGNAWVTKASNEQIKDGLVLVRDSDGQLVGFEGPTLRSQLGDNAPIFDPWDFNRTLATHEKTLVANARLGLHALTNLHDFLVSAWKYGALLRPGLMFRSQLDTYPRVLASLSAGESFGAAMNGAVNFTHNRGLQGLAKIRMSGKPADQLAAEMRFIGTKPVKAGSRGQYTGQFARDASEYQNYLSASSKGQTVHNALFHQMSDRYSGLKLDRASQVRAEAGSEHWHIAYKEYADQLLASPSARKLMDLVNKDTLDPGVLEKFKRSPEFTAEYRKYAQLDGLSREQFLQQLIHEVSSMFPDASIVKAAKSSGLNRKFIDKAFPRDARFQVPAPEMSVVGGRMAPLKDAVDGMYRVLLDKPDMWFGRSPVVTQLYNRYFKHEVAAMEARLGKGVEISPSELAKLDYKARNQAIGYVRNTFFDTTRYTGLHNAVARFSPFVAAWEDAMISWGRLIYDDPRRMWKLSAAYHSPFTVAASNNIDLVVDNNGQPITPNSNADGVYINVPLGALGKKIGVNHYRIRLDSINSIAQGETWWLPGVGPTVQMAATYALGSGKIVSREAALSIADTKNPLGKAFLKSVFLGGEVPPSDPATLAQSALPGWLRTFTTETLTTGKLRTRQTSFNYLVGQAMADGKQLTPDDYTRLWDKADSMANAAAVVRLAASAGFGMTGSATVDGQFYVDQMHIIYGMTPEQRGGLSPTEFFAQEYPEAADLDWSVTQNKTGINATVNAAKNESKLAGVLRNNPAEIGWMILGAQNIVDEQGQQATPFSRTAYSMQRSDGSRSYKDAATAQLDAQAAVGYRLEAAYEQQVSDALVAKGMDPNTVETSDAFKTARKAIREYVSSQNPAYARKQTEFKNNFKFYYGQAKRLASSGPLKDRADMQAFLDYDAARTQVMQAFNIGSFDGTSPQYQQAKAVMYQAGTQLAAQNLGFQQMWQRFLEKEVS